MRGKLARQPTGPAGPFAYMARTATAFTERQHERGFTETDERKCKAGNQAQSIGSWWSSPFRDSKQYAYG